MVEEDLPVTKKKKKKKDGSSLTLFIQPLSVSLGGDSALLMYQMSECIRKMKKHLQTIKELQTLMV